MELYNKISAEERRLLIEAENTERVTLSFYKYSKILNPKLFRDYLFLHWNSMSILGRIYIAHEGINAQISLPAFKLKKFRTFLDEISFLKYTCGCRKPDIGLYNELERFFNVDKNESIMFGDTIRDRDFAANCGIKFQLIK